MLFLNSSFIVCNKMTKKSKFDFSWVNLVNLGKKQHYISKQIKVD